MKAGADQLDSLDEGSTGKYQHEVEEVPEGADQGNSQDLMLIFSCTSRLESRYIHYPMSKSDVFHISCPRACTSQYHPLGWYWLAGWLVQALGHVLWNTHSGVRCTCSVKTKSALENFLDKVRGTETVKTMYMAFRNWIMSNTKERRFSSTNS